MLLPVCRPTRVLLRTSRKGPGSWSNPTLRTGREQQRQHHEEGSIGGTAAAAGNYYGANNWRADPRLVEVPPDIKRYREGTGTHRYGSRTQSQRVAHDRQGAASGSGGRRTAEPRERSINWVGGTHSGRSPLMDADIGGRLDEESTLADRMHSFLFTLFEPREADSRIFGGDNATQRANLREDLKSMHSGISPFAHLDLLGDTLKNIKQLRSPSGQLCPRELLKGRIVGLLFFSESARSTSFMHVLSRFHRANSPDFVAVALSLGVKEMQDVTGPLGLFHCMHRDGSVSVQRDVGLIVSPFQPLPRLYIVDGTSGGTITNQGVTAVVVRPETCMQAWKMGLSGVQPWDWLQAIYM